MDQRSLNERASEETLISLLQLDPSPIEDSQAGEAESSEKELPPLPDDAEQDAAGSFSFSRTASATSSSLGLSGNAGHGSIYYCACLPSQPKQQPLHP